MHDLSVHWQLTGIECCISSALEGEDAFQQCQDRSNKTHERRTPLPMKRAITLALSLAIFAAPTIAFSADVAPGNVKFTGLAVAEPVSSEPGDAAAWRAVGPVVGGA